MLKKKHFLHVLTHTHIWECSKRGGGGTWFQLYPDVCVEKGRTWVPFRPQVSEMSDMISLKMGVNFATSLNMGGKLPPKVYIITWRIPISGQILHQLYKIYSKQRDIE